MIRDFGIVWSERDLLLSGLGNTTILSVLSAVAALLFGFVLAPALMSKQLWFAGIVRGFVDGMRCVPFLLFAYIVYYGLPSLGIRLDNWTSGLVALTIYNAAYMAEIIRAGIRSINRGQTEAASAVGMTYPQITRFVILPQALRVVYPPLVSQWISIVLFSSLASVIAYPELAEHAKRLDSRTFRSFEIYAAVTVIYTVCTLSLALVLRLVERRAFPVAR